MPVLNGMHLPYAGTRFALNETNEESGSKSLPLQQIETLATEKKIVELADNNARFTPAL